jgi:hypothetical protein
MLPILRIIPVGGVFLAIMILVLSLSPPGGSRPGMPRALLAARGPLIESDEHPEWRQMLILAGGKPAGDQDAGTRKAAARKPAKGSPSRQPRGGGGGGGGKNDGAPAVQSFGINIRQFPGQNAAGRYGAGSTVGGGRANPAIEFNFLAPAFAAARVRSRLAAIERRSCAGRRGQRPLTQARRRQHSMQIR